MSQQNAPGKTVFDVAKVIAEELKHLPDKQQQEQAIRYASDSLGLAAGWQPAVSPDPLREAGTKNPPQPGNPPVPAPDIRTFTAEKAPKNDIQFAAVAAYYYRFLAPEQDQKDAINGTDLQDAARKADRRRPGNAAQTLRNAKNAGYLDSGGRGQFRINAVGENLVAVTLPGGSSEAPGGKPARPRAKPKKQGVKNKSGPKKLKQRGR
ncbi:MAG: hypothetical protein AB7Q17_04315 [Phycisphaerae bacterium]